MYTYIIYDDKYYKIGKTKNLKSRLTSIKTSNPSIKLLLFLNKDIEKELHLTFKDKNVAGEWFDLSLSDIEYLKTIMDINDTIIVTTKPVRKTKILPDMQDIVEKRKSHIKAVQQGKVDKTKIEIVQNIDNWDYNEFGKITQSKLAKVSGKNIKTIETYYPIYKQKIRELNTNWKNKQEIIK